MSMQDPIADMFTRIRNGQMAGKTKVTMPFSSKKAEIAKLLIAEGYIISSIEYKEQDKFFLKIELKYFNGLPVIETIDRISRPGLRIYKGAKDLIEVNSGFGISIISTSKGLMTDRRARTENLGGEIICNVF